MNRFGVVHRIEGGKCVQRNFSKGFLDRSEMNVNEGTSGIWFIDVTKHCWRGETSEQMFNWMSAHACVFSVNSLSCQMNRFLSLFLSRSDILVVINLDQCERVQLFIFTFGLLHHSSSCSIVDWPFSIRCWWPTEKTMPRPTFSLSKFSLLSSRWTNRKWIEPRKWPVNAAGAHSSHASSCKFHQSID